MITATRTSAATPSVLRSTVEDEGIDDLIAVGLSLHLFTELVREHLDLADTDLHRATTVLTKQVIDTLARQLTTGKDPLEAIQRLITDPVARCGGGGSAVRTAAFQRAEMTIRGALDYGVVPMLRLAATRAVTQQAPWWGTPAWRARLERHVAASPLEHLTLSAAPELAPDDTLLALVA
jgi:hypothetical protein